MDAAYCCSQHHKNTGYMQGDEVFVPNQKAAGRF
jgi:hypothetical protein